MKQYPFNATNCYTFQEIKDLKLWLLLLTTANQGISLNGLTLRQPTRITFSDTCPFGLGGFTSFGQAWRLKIHSVPGNGVRILPPPNHPLYLRSTVEIPNRTYP